MRFRLEHVQKPLILRCPSLGNTHRTSSTFRISSLVRLVCGAFDHALFLSSRVSKHALVASVTLLSIFVPFLASAQTVGGAAPLTLTLSPMYPRPYDSVTVTPSSNVLDMASTKTSFYVNGTKIADKNGTEAATVQMGGAGVQSTIKVTALYAGKTYTESMTVRPTDVALVTESKATSHPFYRGANLVASQGTVYLVAVPDLRTSPTNRILATNLVYTWKLGTQLLEAQSGIGKSVLNVLAPPRYRDATVTVTVTSQDGSLAGFASTTLTPANALLRLYELDPLLGPRYDTALSSSYTMSGNEATFLAVPYFFAKIPVFAWLLNGTAAGANSSLTMRQSGSGTGTSNIDLSASLDTFTSSDASIQVSFGKSTSSGFFGL